MGFGIAFIGGIITFISPCVLPMIPMYIAYISGVSVKDLKDGGAKKPLLKILAYSLFFVLGFMIVFTALGALFYIFFNALGAWKVWINRAAGAIIIIFGLHIMGVFRIPFLNREARVTPGVKKTSPLSALVMGLAFGAGWTPCVGPILSGIIMTGANSSTALTAVLQLAVYSLGLGIPFVLTGLLTNRLMAVFDFIKKHYRVIEIISGIFLIALGVLLALDLMGALSGFFSRLLPGLGDIEGKLVK